MSDADQQAPAMDALVVEDDPRYREFLIQALKELQQLEAVGVATAEQAKRMIALHPPQILLLDLNLPGMGGLELASWMHQQKLPTQVIILTGYGTVDTVRQALRLEVADFLTKPCHLGELEQALDRALRRLTFEPGAAGGGKDARPQPADAQQPTETKPAAESPPDLPADSPPDAQRVTLEQVERQHILATLARHQGNRSATAAELGISLRTLYYRLAQYQQQGHL